MIGTPLEVDAKRVVCSVSIGVASPPDDGNTMDAIVARADRAMYRAKQEGRNPVVQFQPSASAA